MIVPTNTTVPNTTAETTAPIPVEIEINAVIAELKHVRARRDSFTQEQLVTLAKRTIPVLETFYAQTEDETTVGYIESAQGGIEHTLDRLKLTTVPTAPSLVPMLLLAIDAIEAVQEENETN